MVVALNYHRRHGLNCPGNHPAGTYTSEPEERKKGWARCQCPIYASGSLDRVARRLATKQTDWQAARAVTAPYLAANSWNLPDTPPPTPQPPRGESTPSPAADTTAPLPTSTHVLIETATKAYLTEHQQAQSAAGTLRKYGYLTARIHRFSSDMGLRYIHEWTPALVRQFRDSWGVAPLTASKTLGNLKAFFQFCLQNEWILRNPAGIKTRRNRSLSQDSCQKIPFTNQELEQMYQGCRDYGRTLIREWPKKQQGRQVTAINTHRDYHRIWTGDDLADFISVSVYTGLRISDVATFHVDRLRDTGEVQIRTTKSGSKVYTWVPDWLADRIRARAVRVGPFIFGTHTTTDLNVITDVWRRKLNVLWDQSGPWKEHPTPHRFRHTFARILLQNNTPIPTVAELMGNTEQIVRKHYAAWVPERQEKTTAILREAFRHTPTPHASHTKARKIKQG
jgi:integrase